MKYLIKYLWACMTFPARLMITGTLIIGIFLIVVGTFVMYSHTGTTTPGTGGVTTPEIDGTTAPGAVPSLISIATTAMQVANVHLNDLDTRFKALKIQIEKDINDKNHLSRAIVLLDETKKRRTELKEIADQFYVDSEVALREIKDKEKQREELYANFKEMQEDAKKAGLPKFADATAEDKAKTVLQIGTKAYTGREIYSVLERYKADIQRADHDIACQRELSDSLKGQAEKIYSSWIPRVDDFITKLDSVIGGLERNQPLMVAREIMKIPSDIGANDLIQALKKTQYTQDVLLEKTDSEERVNELYKGSSRNPSFSITDDDLI